MLENFIDTKILLITLSLTIFYYYINDNDNIVLEQKNISK